jgi:hypothetical protein
MSPSQLVTKPSFSILPLPHIIIKEQVYDHLDKGLDAIEDGESACSN